MVGYSADKADLPIYTYPIAGAASGVLTRAIAQPLDVLKIRFQLQVESTKHSGKYQGVIQAARVINKEEGIRAFWKGHVPAQLLSFMYGVVQFGTFEIVTLLWAKVPIEHTEEFRPVAHFFCGGIAGCTATLFSMPPDVIRTRFIAQGEPKIYKSLVHACRCMLADEGPRAFFKGLSPTLVQIVPQSACQFGCYSLFTMLWGKAFSNRDQNNEETQGHKVGWLQSLLCGSAAGFVAKTIVYPLDLTKKRLQVQGFEKGWSMHSKTREYSNFINCIKVILKEEGFRGLFRGLSPSLVKAVVTTGFHFLAYEQSINLFAYYYRTSKE